MKRQSKLSSQAKVLDNIKNQFSMFRRIGVGGRHYSPRLRSLAAAAVSDGLGQSEVAQAAGVSPSTVFCWALSVPKVRQLKLVETPSRQRVDRDISVKEAPICIRLASGVEIDLPPDRLTAELLTSLNSIKSRQ